MPATWVPWPFASAGSLSSSTQSQPRQSSTSPLASSSSPLASRPPPVSPGLRATLGSRSVLVTSTPLSRTPTVTAALPLVRFQAAGMPIMCRPHCWVKKGRSRRRRPRGSRRAPRRGSLRSARASRLPPPPTRPAGDPRAASRSGAAPARTRCRFAAVRQGGPPAVCRFGKRTRTWPAPVSAGSWPDAAAGAHRASTTPSVTVPLKCPCLTQALSTPPRRSETGALKHPSTTTEGPLIAGPPSRLVPVATACCRPREPRCAGRGNRAPAFPRPCRRRRRRRRRCRPPAPGG